MDNASQGGLSIVVPDHIPSGTLIRVDHDDVMYLGEVVYCVKCESGYRLGVQFEHSLRRIDVLRNLIDALSTSRAQARKPFTPA